MVKVHNITLACLQTELNEKNLQIENENKKHAELRQSTATMREEVKQLAVRRVERQNSSG